MPVGSSPTIETRNVLTAPDRPWIQIGAAGQITPMGARRRRRSGPSPLVMASKAGSTKNLKACRKRRVSARHRVPFLVLPGACAVRKIAIGYERREKGLFRWGGNSGCQQYPG
jgi:hypothetical protein